MTTWVNGGLSNAALTGALLGLGLAAPPAGESADAAGGRRRPQPPSDRWGADATETGWMPRYPQGSPPPGAGQQPVNPTDGFLAGSVTALASATPAGWNAAATAIGPWGEPTRLTRMPRASSLLADLPEPKTSPEGLSRPASVPPATSVSSVPVHEVAAPPLSAEPVDAAHHAPQSVGGYAPGYDSISAPTQVALPPNESQPATDPEDDPLGTGSLDRSRLEPALLEPARPESPSYPGGTSSEPSMAELTGLAEPSVTADAGPAEQPGYASSLEPPAASGYASSLEPPAASGYEAGVGSGAASGYGAQAPLGSDAGSEPAADGPGRDPLTDPLTGEGPALGSLDSSSLFEALSRRTG